MRWAGSGIGVGAAGRGVGFSAERLGRTHNRRILCRAGWRAVSILGVLLGAGDEPPEPTRKGSLMGLSAQVGMVCGRGWPRGLRLVVAFAAGVGGPGVAAPPVLASGVCGSSGAY